MCGISLDYGEAVKIPESIMAKVSPKRSTEEILWEYVEYTPGYCSECHKRVIEIAQTAEKEIFDDLPPDHKAFLDRISAKLKDMDQATVDTIVKLVDTKNIPPEVYDVITRTMAQEFVKVIAAFMLLKIEDILFIEFQNDPDKFIHKVWQRCRDELS